MPHRRRLPSNRLPFAPTVPITVVTRHIGDRPYRGQQQRVVIRVSCTRPAERATEQRGRADRIDRNAHVHSPTLPPGWLWRRWLRVVSTGLLRRRTRLPRLRHPTTRRELPTRWRTLRRLPRLRHPTTRRELPTGRWALRRLS